MTEVPPEVFAEFHGPENYPFLRREWLRALEEPGAVSTRTGWIPRHLALYWGTELIAFAPNYIKLHSLGEFVFDQGWAEYSEHQLGVAYYPKSVVCVPFTPATGPRLLFRKGLGAKERETCWDVLTGALPEVAKKLQLSSVHWLFPEEQQGEELEERDWLVRWGVQYQYHRGAAQSFDDYLGSFRSKKRSCIRRERRAMEEQRVQIQRLEGEELGEVSPQLAYALYLSTIDKYFYGRRYLPESFFEKVFQTMPDGLQFVVARDEESSEVIAGALNLLGKEALFGRYWGALKEKPFLHFNIC
ncbi:MAG: GNAT family N-acetyltransferase, partial [Polyangiaceae bacterium]|nr:GNAT family N-acetyltransferase [Polyangiaceae bacterium]